MYGNFYGHFNGKIDACACSEYQAFPLPSIEGLGTRLHVHTPTWCVYMYVYSTMHDCHSFCMVCNHMQITTGLALIRFVHCGEYIHHPPTSIHNINVGILSTVPYILLHSPHKLNKTDHTVMVIVYNISLIIMTRYRKSGNFRCKNIFVVDRN